MRVLFVLENYLPHIGGVEILFKNICEGLASKGHDVTIVTRRLPGTKRKEVKNGVRILRIGSMNSRYLFTFASIPEVIRQARLVDVIHTTTYNSAFPSWLARILTGTPAIITVHETWLGHWHEYTNFSWAKAALHELFERMIYVLSFDRYVGVSRSTEMQLKSAVPKIKKKVLHIHNGFEASMWRKRRNTSGIRKKMGLEERFVIFASGRPGTSKGFEYLVDAFPKIKEDLPNAKLVLMLSKDRQYRHKIDEFKKRAHKDIVFVDPVPFDELPAWRQMADCIVVPSVTEGFGYALLESIATGSPVVASNTMSIPEVISGKYVLVKPKSSLAIAKGVVKVRKGKFTKKKFKPFPWKDTLDGYEKVYRQVIR